METSNIMSEVVSIMRSWEEEHVQPNFNPVSTLSRLAEIIETETENYLKMDPDPFDERHPSRTDPDCKLGQILKVLFRKDIFMNKLVGEYLRDNRNGMSSKDIDQLHIAACRIMLDILPGLETSVVFQPDTDSLILRLIKWATNSVEPLQSYATGLLAAAMEIPEIAIRFREQNAKMVPLLLKRLRRLQSNSDFITNTSRPFSHLSTTKSPLKIDHKSSSIRKDGLFTPPKSEDANEERQDISVPYKRKSFENYQPFSENAKKVKFGPSVSPRNDPVPPPKTSEPLISPITSTNQGNKAQAFNECSNSSWAELESFMIGSIQIFPPTDATRQILILRYLTPMGEYQEFLSHVFENNALELICNYVNIRETKKARLAFEALKYLAALLCHKKFSIEFIQIKGLEALLEVPRPSIAATGVSICLYYLGYCEESMELVCLLPKHIVASLVNYALWLLECSHDSGRCHATMFFGLTFEFKVILDEFDAQDGLRKLHNVISTLPILSSDLTMVNEDVECAARQIVRHVCVAFKKYLEAHLYIKSEHFRRSQIGSGDKSNLHAIPQHPTFKPCKSTSEEVQQQIEILLQNMPFRTHWAPVEQLLKLGAITLLLKIIAFAYEWNYSGRAETVRSALDVLSITCIMPKVLVLLCERVDLPEELITLGMTIILGAAEGEIVADADVQKSALRVIVNCVCAPIVRVSGSLAKLSSNSINSPNKKTKLKSSEDLIQKVWDCVRTNNGIMVLLTLMNIKTPITDADCIRTLACKALSGLARSDTVRQIVSKLPIFQNGQLQNLMRDPILQEKRQEHVTFQKHALELLERLSGRSNTKNNETDISLINIHRASVVAQTKIQFNDKQLIQLIHHHLLSKGLGESAGVLQREAKLGVTSQHCGALHPSKFRYGCSLTPSKTKISFTSHTPTAKSNLNQSLHLSEGNSETNVVPTTPVVNGVLNIPQPIKIIKKVNVNLNSPATPQNSRLQKQISGEPNLKIVLPGQSTSEEIEPRINLESIITEYLINQHALCKNPMTTCPQFNLFVPHKCPDPKPRITSSANFIMRNARRQMGFFSKNMDKKLIHTRFCPVQTIRYPTEEGFFTCSKFLPGNQNIVVGDFAGEVRIFNTHNGNEESVFTAHDSYIINVEPNWTGELLLISSTWGRPLSSLWSIKDSDLKFNFDVEDYVEFSKLTQDRILGTKGETATIYDVNTGKEISRLIPKICNQYTKNRATFSQNDELVLSDGVLFDVASGKPIHKLDKLNQTLSGVFHPNGYEIVSNTEVWDMRTFHLLKTVPALNQCNVIFAPVNNAIYGVSVEQEKDDDTTYDSSFKTLDASDYSSIATIDVKRNIYDVVVNNFDSQIAIVENQGLYHAVQESVVRLYDVGRRRDDSDDQEEDDEEDEGDLDGSDDDASDGEGHRTDNDNENNDNNANEDGDEEEEDNEWSDLTIDSSDSFSDGSSEISLENFILNL